MKKPCSNGRNTPKDVKIAGWFVMMCALLAMLSGASLLSGVVTIVRPWSELQFFGLIRLKSEAAIGISHVAHGAVGVVVALGLMKGRSWAWWIQWIFLLAGIPHYFDGRIAIGWKVGTLVLESLFAVWLVFRVRFYRPFGEKLRIKEEDKSVN